MWDQDGFPEEVASKGGLEGQVVALQVKRARKNVLEAGAYARFTGNYSHVKTQQFEGALSCSACPYCLGFKCNILCF